MPTLQRNLHLIKTVLPFIISTSQTKAMENIRYRNLFAPLHKNRNELYGITKRKTFNTIFLVSEEVLYFTTVIVPTWF